MKRFLSVFLLMSGLLVAGGAKAGLVLGTGALSNNISNNIQVDNIQWPGFQFTTGSSQASLQSIDIAFTSDVTDNYTFRLYAASVSGLPVNGATPLATYTASTISTTAYNSNLATLTTINFGGALSSYQLAANTSYVLVVEGSAVNNQYFVNNNQLATQLNSSGWSSSLGFLVTSDSGQTWTDLGNQGAFIFNLSATTNSPTVSPAPIPTLSEWAQLLLALMVLAMVGWHFHRERSY